MTRRILLVATVAVLGSAASIAHAQANRAPAANPLRFNNPLNQAGMYNNDPVLRFNNPLNQAGMYNNVPVLRYNNPIVQGNMYGNGGVIYGGTLPATGGNVVNGQAAVNQAGANGNRVFTTNGAMRFAGTGYPGVVGAVGGYGGAVPLYPNGSIYGDGFLPMAPLGNPFYQGSLFGWGTPNPMGVNAMPAGGGFDPTLIGAGGPNVPPSFSDGQGVAESGKSDPAAASLLNGASGGVRSAYTPHSANTGKDAPKSKAKASRPSSKRRPSRPIH